MRGPKRLLRQQPHQQGLDTKRTCTVTTLDEVSSSCYRDASVVLMEAYSGFGVYMKSMDKLPSVLMDPDKTHATAPNEAPFQEALGTKLTFWEWCEQDVIQSDGSVGPNPLLRTFTSSMMATGQLVSSSIIHGVPSYLLQGHTRR